MAEQTPSPAASTTLGGRKTKLSKQRVEALRARLEAERTELTAQIARLDADMQHDSWKHPRSDDDAEWGSATFERARLLSMAGNARRLVSQIDAALKRMDAGTYGVCVSCGQAIHPDRLDALPQAAQCMECRRRDERSGR